LEKIIDELVSNVLKHSGASHVRMRMATGATGVILRFSDDGAGFDQGGRISGSGLGNIRYRIEALGGTVRLQTSPGAGTAYAIAIPAVSTGVHR
jgi:methyl-accepting chemotaxis protein